MKFILFVLISISTLSAETYIQSVPQTRFTSYALFSGLSNQGMDGNFLSCPRSNFGLLSVILTFKSAGKISPCVSSMISQSCQSVGDTSRATAIDTAIGDQVFLGYNPSTRSFEVNDLSVDARYDGTFLAVRSCVDQRFLR